MRQTEPVSALDRSRPFVGWSGLLESGPIGTLPPVTSALLSEPLANDAGQVFSVPPRSRAESDMVTLSARSVSGQLRSVFFLSQ